MIRLSAMPPFHKQKAFDARRSPGWLNNSVSCRKALQRRDVHCIVLGRSVSEGSDAPPFPVSLIRLKSVERRPGGTLRRALPA